MTVKTIVRHRLFWPLMALLVLLLVNLFEKPDFFSIELVNGNLHGSLIDIALNGAPLMLVALGMTLVIATGGIDLSVGSVVAIAGAIACFYISRQPDQNSVGAVLIAIALALATALVLGAWNGVLVARFGIQPIIATLILLVAGRGIAQLVTSGQIITITSSPYKVISGFWLGLPVVVPIAAVMVGLTAVITRRTALGLLLESVGGNAEASRLVGIRSQTLKIIAYAFCALCAGIAGLMVSSNISAADGNSAGQWIELDAILAVVIGGTSLLGGRFYLGGTVIGALIIQSLTTTILTLGVPSQGTMVFKAVVVIIVCLLPVIRRVRPTRVEPPRVEPSPAQPSRVETAA